MSLEAAAATDLGRTVLRRAASVLGRAVRRDGSSPQGPCRATLRADVAAARRAGARSGRRARRRDELLRAPQPTRLLPPRRRPARRPCAGRRMPGGERRPRAARGGGPRDPDRSSAAARRADARHRRHAGGRSRGPALAAHRGHHRAALAADRGQGHGLGGRALGTAWPHGRHLSCRRQEADGTQWLQRFFELGAGSGPLSLRLGFVGVAGRVRLGTQPLRARLVFFDEAGGEPATLASDDDGRFQGLAAGRARRPGDPLDRRGARGATADQPAPGAASACRRLPARRAAWLELALPIVAVRGTVVLGGGPARSGVQVVLRETPAAEPERSRPPTTRAASSCSSCRRGATPRWPSRSRASRSARRSRWWRASRAS